jgi:hypothetical protein
MNGPDLAGWLLEQIAEDEQRAKAMAAEYPTPWDLADRGWMARVVADGPHFHEVIRVEQHQVSDAADWLGGVIQHVETWNPDRVLAECDAKRRIVELHTGEHECSVYEDNGEINYCQYVLGDCSTLRLLALPYAGRPGHRDDWRP